MSRVLQIALEESSDGKLNQEIERVFYARLEDFTQLQQAAGFEDHDQWEIDIARSERNASSGRIRVRKTTSEQGDVDYVLTSKIKMAGMVPEDHANLEVPTPSSQAQHEQFKLLADKGMIKRRFFFPVSGSELVWEVDVFFTGKKAIQPELRYRPWVKLDLELKSPNQAVPPLPMKFAEVIGHESERTEKQNEIVDWLYENEFLTPNPNRRAGYR